MPPRKSKTPSALRDRIRDFRRIPARDLQANTANWRQHPQFQQDALAGVLKEVGIAGALLVYESQRQGGLCILDGHLRQALTPDQEWPCLVLDVDDAEADYLLSVVDPLSALATADKDRLASLLQHGQSGEAAVQAMLAQLAEREGVVPAEVSHRVSQTVVGFPNDPADSREQSVWNKMGAAVEWRKFEFGEFRLLLPTSLHDALWKYLGESNTKAAQLEIILRRGLDDAQRGVD